LHSRLFTAVLGAAYHRSGKSLRGRTLGNTYFFKPFCYRCCALAPGNALRHLGTDLLVRPGKFLSIIFFK
jgi:hypothetical protein